MAEKTKSPWVWIGCGCAVIVGLGLVVIAAATAIGFQTARTMSDPEAREDKALAILGAAALPPDFETELALSVPFVAKLVVLNGRGSQFVFMRGLRTRADLAAAFVDDDTFDAEVRRAGLKVGRRQEVLARDAIRLGAAEVRYVLFDGAIDFDASGRTSRANFDFDDDDIEADLGAVILLRCSETDSPRLGLWAGPRVDPDDRAADAEGQNASTDRQALVDLLEQFGFCNG